MSGADEAVTRQVLEALPRLRAEYEEKRRSLADEGLESHLAYFFVSEHTTSALREAGSDPGGRAELAEWLGAFEHEWGADPEVDRFISDAVLTFIPDARRDPGGVRRLLGPRLSAAVATLRDVRPDAAQDAFLLRLRRRFPDLEQYVEENTFGDHDALLANPFLSDVVRHAVGLHLSSDPAAHARAQAIVDAVAAEFGHDPRVDELIAVSFVEDLPDPDDPGADIVRRLPPGLVPQQEALRSDLTPIRRDTREGGQAP